MQSIICNAELDDGSQCDGVADVTAARFVYQREIIDGQEDQVLSEVVYAIDCPKCGKRTLVDRANSNEYPTVEIQAAREALANRVPEEASRLNRSSGSGAFFVKLSERRDSQG